MRMFQSLWLVFFTASLMFFRRLLEEFCGLHCMVRGKTEVWIIHFLTRDACYIILILALPAFAYIEKCSKSCFKITMQTSVHIYTTPLCVHIHFDWCYKQKQRYNCICSVWLSSKITQKVTSQNCP